MKFGRFFKTCAQLLFYDPLNIFKHWFDYVNDYKKIKSYMTEQNSIFEIKPDFPCLIDKIDSSGYFGMYIYQDSWAFRHILDRRPKLLVDIASSTYYVAFAAQFTQVISIDIRALKSSMDSIEYRRGDVTKMPFDDDSVDAISTLSVIEHIGLGRYGDVLDVDGMVKAASELSRVLAPGGMLLVAFPVGSENLIRFNAHRICTPEHSVSLFHDLILEDEKYVLRDKVITREEYESIGRPYSYGCYRFTKN
jgi:SAM-dependent methyltransferase